MRFSSLIFRNVLRRKLRSGLTVFAVAIAVGSVVALVGIATGFKDSFLDFYNDVGIDLVVVRSGSQRRLTSNIKQSLTDKIRRLPGVRHVIPGLADIVSFPDYNLQVVPVSGMVPETAIFDHFTILEGQGRQLKRSDKRAVVLGVNLAETLDKKPGDKLDVVDGETFDVIGVFESSNVIENGSILMTLEDLQELMDKKGQITGISIVMQDHADEQDRDAAAAAIRKMENGLSVRSTQDHVESLTEIQMAIAMAWLTSTVAIVIGGLGVLNTMFMAIQERTHEIGILRAVGWDRGRVIGMILGESLMIALIGGLVGATAAIVVVQLLTYAPAVNGLIQSRIDPIILGEGFVVAMVLGLAGGLLPALAASRLPPTDALQR